MVYNWEDYKDVITRLYTQENKQVDEIMRYMSHHYDFKPSKRSYQLQFRLWDLPSRHQPAVNNAALVARVKELWERNLSQAEMMRVLNGVDGFDIKARELQRVRSAHKFLLRGPNEEKDSRRSSQSRDRDSQQDGLHDGDAGETAPLTDDESGADDSAAAARLKEERRLKMEANSRERWENKKRRRRSRKYAGLPADPPGPPRFPSETTVAASIDILGLDKRLYTAVREKFQYICETMGIEKKSLAGTEAWEAAKTELVVAFVHLQNVLWIDKTDLNRKKLALDVICSDVTKRMREVATDTRLTLAEARNILRMNPTEAREVKATFYDILKKDGFISKVTLGKERWKDLKQKWFDESEMLRTVLSRLDDSIDDDTRTKAVELLATDVTKRVRDDQNGRKEARAKGSAAANTAEDIVYTSDNNAMSGDMEDTSEYATMLVPDQSHAQPPRLLSDQLVDPQMHVNMQMPMDTSQLNTQLLLDANAQSGFMGSHQQFLSTPAQMPAAPSPYDNSHAAAFQISTTSPSMIPIYLRQLDPHMNPAGDTWIACLTSPAPSLEELRQVAAQKMPGSRCMEVVGLVRLPNGMGGDFVPLPIHDDAQLGAHLAQDGAPTFHVRLEF
ncbi:hypothetical protein N0V93_001755 [Gnomoniopsis smithogilvyi]|uniref:Clr5 domain-containing protein n=1 Tax=Gnomoniopsis smithogilvyi TaxID=1191159 RepID=A0A9W8Z2M6_9PEZI|nr:hypothetical protein N0V93_001755 [Gnomoniopsis smithogilvyi]